MTDEPITDPDGTKRCPKCEKRLFIDAGEGLSCGGCGWADYEKPSATHPRPEAPRERVVSPGVRWALTALVLLGGVAAFATRRFGLGAIVTLGGLVSLVLNIVAWRRGASEVNEDGEGGRIGGWR